MKKESAGLFRLSAHNDERKYASTLAEAEGVPSLGESGFADGRSETSPDSERIEHTATQLQMRNSSSVEQIQERARERVNCRKRVAFTLAEVLITLGVIGVVAAISLPRFIDNITERANSERHANIAQKVTQAMEQMRAHGLLNTTYPSTEAFVDELQKYLKIAKKCDNNHIADCWPTKTVTAGNGEEFQIANVRNGKYLDLRTKTNNIGLVLADGSSIILNYDSETNGIDIGDRVETYSEDLPVGYGKKQKFSYRTNATNSIDFIMDVNGKKGPNSETINGKYYDIRSFRGANLYNACAEKNGFFVPDLGCVVKIDGDITWLEANSRCQNISMRLPLISELEIMYGQKGKISQIPNSGWYWSSEGYDEYIGAKSPYALRFYNGFVNRFVSDTCRTLCVE